MNCFNAWKWLPPLAEFLYKSQQSSNAWWRSATSPSSTIFPNKQCGFELSTWYWSAGLGYMDKYDFTSIFSGASFEKWKKRFASGGYAIFPFLSRLCCMSPSKTQEALENNVSTELNASRVLKYLYVSFADPITTGFTRRANPGLAVLSSLMCLWIPTIYTIQPECFERCYLLWLQFLCKEKEHGQAIRRIFYVNMHIFTDTICVIVVFPNGCRDLIGYE